MIGHSNERGIVLASGRPLDNWIAFAQYLKPFAPRKLVVVACCAGSALPSRILFSELPTLRRIYSTPVLANRAGQDYGGREFHNGLQRLINAPCGRAVLSPRPITVALKQ